LLSYRELIRLLGDHHRLLVYGDYPRVKHARTHVHAHSGVHATWETGTHSSIEEILHRQTTELIPERCGSRSSPLTL
jgi:hypothetical protein